MNKKRILLKSLILILIIIPTLFTYGQVSWVPVSSPGISPGPALNCASLVKDNTGRLIANYVYTNYPYTRGNCETSTPYGTGWKLLDTDNNPNSRGQYIKFKLGDDNNLYACYDGVDDFKTKEIVSIYENGVMTPATPYNPYSISAGVSQVHIKNNTITTTLRGSKSGTYDKFFAVTRSSFYRWELLAEYTYLSYNIKSLCSAISESGTAYFAFSDIKNASSRLTVLKSVGKSFLNVGEIGFTEGEVDKLSMAVYYEIPYIAYQDLSHDGRISVQRFYNGSWEYVGLPGFSTGKASTTCIHFDKTGTLYVAFADEAYDNRLSVMRYINEEWQYLGTPGFSSPDATFVKLFVDKEGTCYLAYDDSEYHHALTILKYGEPEPGSNIVSFPDPELENAIREVINKPDGDIVKADLASITHLDISSSTTGQIYSLEGLQYCTNLVDLDISRNIFISHLKQLVPLKNLKRLSMDEVNLVSFTEITTLSNLETLSLNKIKTSDISFLTYMPNLKTLYVRDNNIKNVDNLATLPSLTTLDLTGNTNFNDLSSLRGLTSLEKLILPTHADIVDISPLASLPNLNDLYVKSNNIVDASPLISCKNLQHLDISYNKLANLDFLTGLPQLKTLVLNGIHLMYKDLTPLANHPSLTTLEIRSCSLTYFTFLETMQTLRELDISSNYYYDTVTHLGTLDPISSLVNLEKLTINNGRIWNTRPFRTLTSLKSLSLIDTELKEIDYFTTLYSLEHLDLSENQLTDFAELDFLKTLKSLTINNIPDFSDLSPLSALVNLKKLQLNNNSIVNIDPLQNLATLELLEIKNNRIQDISAIANAHNLTVLDAGNNQITDISPLNGHEKLISIDLRDNLIETIDIQNGWNKVTNLNLGSNKLTTIILNNALNVIEDWYIEYNQIQTISFTGSCNSMAQFRIYNQSLEHVYLSDSLKNLKYLNLSDNNLSDISFLEQYDGIQSISLKSNKLQDLASLNHLKDCLYSLNVEYNNMLIRNDGSLGSRNLALLKYMSKNSHSISYKYGNILDDNVGHLKNLALNKPAYASSSYSSAYPARAAVDGDPDTAWGSSMGDYNWIYVDLGQVEEVGALGFSWYDKYYATHYKLYISKDGKNWELINENKEGKGEAVRIFGSYRARYVGLLCVKRNDIAYGVRELEALQLDVDITIKVSLFDDVTSTKTPTTADIEIKNETQSLIKTTVTPESGLVRVYHYAEKYQLIVSKPGYPTRITWLTIDELIALKDKELEIVLHQ